MNWIEAATAARGGGTHGDSRKHKRCAVRLAPTLHLSALILLASCGDLPTEPVPSTERTRHTASESRGTGTVPVVCMISEKSEGGPYAYQYSRLTLRLPRAVAAPDHGTRTFRYRGHSGDEIVLAANCAIPNTAKAAERMTRLFASVGRPAAEANLEGGPLQGGIELGGLEVNVCQYGGEWPYCEEKKPNIVLVKDAAICYDWGCDSSLQPRGGGSSPTPPEPDAEPCKTENPVITSPEVQEGFNTLWQNSNPDANLAQRVEQGGWIVRTATGYEVVRWTNLQVSFCGADGWESNPTTGEVVGFVHTHPYRVGETITNCGFNAIVDYTGQPSDVDVKLGIQLGQAFNRSGPLPGYILDAGGIRQFAKDAPSQTYARCGY